MASVFSAGGHQRTCSQGQQLIPAPSHDDPDDPDEDGAPRAQRDAAAAGCSTQTAHNVSGTLIAHDGGDEAHPYRQQTTTTDAAFDGAQRPGRPLQPEVNAMRFSALSDCSSYYGLPGTHAERESRFLCRNPYLRANKGVVLGAAALTSVGATLLLFGLCAMFLPNEMDVHGWIFLVVGTLFFIPGAYHVTFISCVLCRRPGYSFEDLPTFSKPA